MRTGARTATFGGSLAVQPRARSTEITNALPTGYMLTPDGGEAPEWGLLADVEHRSYPGSGYGTPRVYRKTHPDTHMDSMVVSVLTPYRRHGTVPTMKLCSGIGQPAVSDDDLAGPLCPECGKDFGTQSRKKQQKWGNPYLVGVPRHYDARQMVTTKAVQT